MGAGPGAAWHQSTILSRASNIAFEHENGSVPACSNRQAEHLHIGVKLRRLRRVWT
jgi:hypothetical protein